MNKKILTVTCLLLLAPHAHGMLHVRGLTTVAAQRVQPKALTQSISRAKRGIDRESEKEVSSMKDIIKWSRDRRDQLVKAGQKVPFQVVSCPIADGRAPVAHQSIARKRSDKGCARPIHTIDDCAITQKMVSHFPAAAPIIVRRTVVECATCGKIQACEQTLQRLAY